jgi:hypothetical protein
VLSLDGTTLEVPDPGHRGRVRSAAKPPPPAGRLPQVRLGAVAEGGTHAIIRATIGPFTSGEVTLAPGLRRARPRVLLLADRGVAGCGLWRQATATGAALVWRTKPHPVLAVTQPLADGSSRSQIVAASDHRHRRDPSTVRVVEDSLGKDRGRPGRPRPAADLDPGPHPGTRGRAGRPGPPAGEFETALDELKTHQRGPGVVLCSRSPDLVTQELWACCWSTRPAVA